MATRYYAKGNELYVSPSPVEHKGIQSLGFVPFSAWYAVQFVPKYPHLAEKLIPAGFQLRHMAEVADSGKRGHFGIYRLVDGKFLDHIGDRVVKGPRGQGYHLEVQS